MTIPVVAAIVVLAGLAVLVVATRRRESAGTLSRETVRSDRSHSPYLASPETETARAYERRTVQERRSGPATVMAPLAPPPAAPVHAADPDAIGLGRRQFFGRSVITMMGLGLTGFGGSMLAFLWPRLGSGFGSKVTVGAVDDLFQRIDEERQPVYVAQARTWVGRFPADALAKARGVYPPAVMPGLEAGIIAMYQKCPHLGCRVPFCQASQWFECPCHGSKYTRVGEKKAGPAPRGLDLFPVAIDGGRVTVDTGGALQGLPIGTDVSGQEAEGPHCVGVPTE